MRRVVQRLLSGHEADVLLRREGLVRVELLLFVSGLAEPRGPPAPDADHPGVPRAPGVVVDGVVADGEGGGAHGVGGEAAQGLEVLAGELLGAHAVRSAGVRNHVFPVKLI